MASGFNFNVVAAAAAVLSCIGGLVVLVGVCTTELVDNDCDMTTVSTDGDSSSLEAFREAGRCEGCCC